jgi:integrase
LLDFDEDVCEMGSRETEEPVMTKRITESLAAALQAKVSDKDEFIFDALLSGYGLRRTPAGVVIHIAVARAAGHKVRTTLGKWPAMKTAEARSLAGMAIADVREGRDPLLERRARLRAAAVNGVTVSAYAEKWMEHVRLKRKPKTARDYAHILNNHVLPAFGHRTIAEIRPDDVDALHVKLQATPRMANYVTATFGVMMRHAIQAGLRRDNPCRDVVRYREKGRERFLSPREFAAAVEAIDKAVGNKVISPRAAAGLKLLMFTGARRSEIRAALWSHVDWTRRLIRLPDSKTNTPRTIHLSDAAIAVLHSLPRDGTFVIGGGEAFLNAAWSVVRSRCGLTDVRVHDLRHSYASAALAAGVPLAMVGKLLGHAHAGTTSRYAHLAADDAAAANDVVGAALAGMTTKPSSGTVVKLRRGRR